jgi:hypothetical protein
MSDRLDFDEGIARQSRHLDGGSRGRYSWENLGVDRVDLLKLSEIDEVDRRLDDVLEASSRGREHGPEVREHLADLCLDATLHELTARGIERDLAAAKQQLSRANGL